MKKEKGTSSPDVVWTIEQLWLRSPADSGMAESGNEGAGSCGWQVAKKALPEMTDVDRTLSEGRNQR